MTVGVNREVGGGGNMNVGMNREDGGGGKHDCWCEPGSWWRRKT